MIRNQSQLETARRWFGTSILNAVLLWTRQATVTVLVAVTIIALGFPVSRAQSDLISKGGAKAIDSIKAAWSSGPRSRPTQPVPGRNESPSERASRTALLRLCPKKLSLHVEESYTLVPLPMDLDRRTIHGAETTWSSSDPSVASVASFGEVEARSPGRAVITVQIGDKRANVLVDVEAGVRQRVTDAEWDERHANDCDDPEALATDSTPPAEGERRKAEVRWIPFEQSAPTDVSGPAAQLKDGTERAVSSAARLAARPAAMRTLRRVSTKALMTAPGSAMPTRAKPFLPLQGGGAFEFFPEATFVENAVGSPRFSPVEVTNGATRMKNNLGSSNYAFAAGLLGLGGRGIGVNLELIYNGQLWNKDSSGPTTMRFNYNKGMLAAGWAMGYGRIIPNYDDTDTGDGSSDGFGNAPGNYLLVSADGTRVHLAQIWDNADGKWNHVSRDGLHTTYNPRNLKLRYSDGTLVRYFDKNGKLLPNQIKTRNGDVIAMDYKDHDQTTFPNRFSLEYIKDTLGRMIEFYYYGDAGYPADPPNGKPLAALAAVTTPDKLNGPPRELVRIEYQTITVQHDFNDNFTIDGPANNSPLTVVKRIAYPATGRGYLFLDYSTYGMCRYISVRKDVIGTGGAITEGTEVAYTKYNFPSIGGAELNRAPEYTTRKEWWQGHPNGAFPTEYTYSRSHGGGTETDTVTEVMPVTGTLINTVTTSTNGQVETVERKMGATVLGSVLYVYDFFTPELLTGSSVTNEAGQTASTTFEYSASDAQYGRVSKVHESSFDSTTVRRTEYQYSNTSDHLSVNLSRLATQVAVFDAQTNQMKQKTVLTYDNYAGGIQTYASIPTTHDLTFDTAYTIRGNVTGIQTFSSISPPVSTTRLSRFDIFGNVVEAELSCCQVKTFAFSLNTTWYSQPDTVTNGEIGVAPFLTTAYQYDLNTGLVTQVTDPDNGITTFEYDAAWRLLTATGPTGAQVTTTPDPLNGNDQLSYSEAVTYPEGTSSKTITTRSWFDGAGRVLRRGVGAGSSPSNYDTVAADYDAMGRTSRVSNPYLGNTSGIGSATGWTVNTYDELHRVKLVTLPDSQTVQTGYNGSETTVTDQVGRKKRSTVDALGRLISVTEQDTTTGGLTVTTSYSYDAVDNLLQTNQAGQLRTFTYDALSRVKSEATPEGGTVTFTYTDFGAVLTRIHQAREVETHYKYDSLHRLIEVWYTGLGGDVAGLLRPALPSAVAPTSDVDITYRTAAPGNGQVSSVTDGQITGFSSSESYTYESLTGRLISKTRVIDVDSYQTQYQYNGISQVTLMVYPSGRRVRANYDSRGRMSGEDEVDADGAFLKSYASSISYNVAGQLTGITLGNEVNEVFSYSADRLQLTGQTAVKGASTIMSLTYGYGAAAGASGANTTAGNSGQLMSVGGTIAGTSRSQAFTYDNVTRLKTANGWSSWSQSYGYDNRNNLTSITGTQPKAISVDPATNRILNVSGSSYSHDSAGNVTSDGVHSYKYDAAGRVAKVDAGSGNETSYYYDFQNWRVKKTSTANTINYIWEGGRVIAEYNSAPPQGSGGTRYYHQDRLSTRTITNEDGVVVGTNDHLPFGESFATSGDVEKHQFTSYERDGETDTDYAVNRQYGAKVGRFMQPDPVGGSVGNPQSLNRYTYVRNDPVNLTDPLGLYCVEVCISIEGGGRSCRWECYITPDYDLIVPISSFGPFGPGEVPVIDFAGGFPPAPTSQNSSSDPCAGKDLAQLQNQFAQSVANAIPGAVIRYDKDSNVANGITFAGTYEETTSQLSKAGYYTGVFAFNPFNHKGGQEFRTYGSPGFHFAVKYPEYERQFQMSGARNDYYRFVRKPGPTIGRELHIDCSNPVGSSLADKLKHLIDFLEHNGIRGNEFPPYP